MTTHVSTLPVARRKERVIASLKSIVQDLTGINPAGMDVHANFYDVGVDSLMLIQATQAIQDRFAVKLPVVQLLEELNTLDAVATYLEQALPPDEEDNAAPSAQLPAPPTATPSTSTAAPTPAATPAPPPATAPSIASPAATTVAASVSPSVPPATTPPPAPLFTPPPATYANGPVADVPESATNFAEQPDLAASALEQLLARQLQVMGQQLANCRECVADDARPRVSRRAAAALAAAAG
jgi:acyl carrier protein